MPMCGSGRFKCVALVKCRCQLLVRQLFLLLLFHSFSLHWLGMHSGSRMSDEECAGLMFDAIEAHSSIAPLPYDFCLLFSFSFRIL
eukprot:scaffold62487_cov18-Tisochrysis_lutea.AAC.1